jgi:hypothetical protein
MHAKQIEDVEKAKRFGLFLQQRHLPVEVRDEDGQLVPIEANA